MLLLLLGRREGAPVIATDQGAVAEQATEEVLEVLMTSGTSRDKWLPIALAHSNCDLKLGDICATGIEARSSGVWFNVWTSEPVLVHPTHWRSWRR